jgi:hypothetical protein
MNISKAIGVLSAAATPFASNSSIQACAALQDSQSNCRLTSIQGLEVSVKARDIRLINVSSE